jgi:hypothetical protein
VTRGRHHAISIILDGMLITCARRHTACRPLFARCSAAVATGLILAAQYADSDWGIAIVVACGQAISRREEPRCE